MYVDYANADVAAFNTRLDGAAGAATERRRTKVLADRELVASLGVPVKDREQATPTYSVAPSRRKAARPSPTRSVGRNLISAGITI